LHIKEPRGGKRETRAMLGLTNGRAVVHSTVCARSDSTVLHSRAHGTKPRPVAASRSSFLRVRVVRGGGAPARRAGHITSALDGENEHGFGDIDKLAAGAQTARGGTESEGGVATRSEEARIMSIGSDGVSEFGLSGRPLYVCQTMWWRRLSQLKMYAPDAVEIRDYARRSGLSYGTVEKWFNDALEHYHDLPLTEKAKYEDECQAKLNRMDLLVSKLAKENPGVFMGRDDDPVHMDAPWNEDGKLTEEEQETLTLIDPLYQAMSELPQVMAEEAAAAKEEKEVEEGLDDEAIARIPQDGSKEKPFLVNPYTNSKSGKWSVEKPVGSPNEYEESETWLEAGGWDALPDHDIVSAVDGSSLHYVGVNNDDHVPRDLWKLDRPAERENLVMAEEVSSDGIQRDARKFVGDTSKTRLHDLKVGTELEGTIIAQELYHGALVDCGCEADGLITISETEWPGVRDKLFLGAKVRVKITAVHQKWWRFRFPIELSVVDPNVGHLITMHPHEDGPPINIYNGETVPFAHFDAGRPLDRFIEAARIDPEVEEENRVKAVSDWVDMKMEEGAASQKKKGTKNRMQKVLAQAAAAADGAKEKSTVTPPEEDDDTPVAPDGGAAEALNVGDGIRTMGVRTEDMIAAEEEEEEAALFGDEKSANMADQREDPDAVEEGDDEETTVDTAAEDNLAMNLNPEAEDTRGGMLNGVDDLEPAPGDLDDDDGDDDFSAIDEEEDDLGGIAGAR
jgi:hypothetical protein